MTTTECFLLYLAHRREASYWGDVWPYERWLKAHESAFPVFAFIGFDFAKSTMDC